MVNEEITYIVNLSPWQPWAEWSICINHSAHGCLFNFKCNLQLKAGLNHAILFRYCLKGENC